MMKFESLSNCQNGFVMQSGFSSFIVAYNKSSSYNFWFASIGMMFQIGPAGGDHIGARSC